MSIEGVAWKLFRSRHSGEGRNPRDHRLVCACGKFHCRGAGGLALNNRNNPHLQGDRWIAPFGAMTAVV